MPIRLGFLNTFPAFPYLLSSTIPLSNSVPGLHPDASPLSTEHLGALKASGGIATSRDQQRPPVGASIRDKGVRSRQKIANAAGNRRDGVIGHGQWGNGGGM